MPLPFNVFYKEAVNFLPYVMKLSNTKNPQPGCEFFVFMVIKNKKTNSNT